MEEERRIAKGRNEDGEAILVLMCFGPLLELANSVVLLFGGKRADWS